MLTSICVQRTLNSIKSFSALFTIRWVISKSKQNIKSRTKIQKSRYFKFSLTARTITQHIVVGVRTDSYVETEQFVEQKFASSIQRHVRLLKEKPSLYVTHPRYVHFPFQISPRNDRRPRFELQVKASIVKYAFARTNQESCVLRAYNLFTELNFLTIVTTKSGVTRKTRWRTHLQ